LRSIPGRAFYRSVRAAAWRVHQQADCCGDRHGSPQTYWVVNLFYTLIVGWNVIVTALLYAKAH
jgi:hypothetical protein